jgi:hypothetical protein
LLDCILPWFEHPTADYPLRLDFLVHLRLGTHTALVELPEALNVAALGELTKPLLRFTHWCTYVDGQNCEGFHR